MRYSKVYLDSMGYELGPVVVTSRELEERLASVYEKFNISEGQLEEWTGIFERRWWEKGYPISEGAIAAARKALAASNAKPKDIDILIYGGVSREGFEPANACKIADALGISPDALVYDVSNACLGALNGMINIANRIELGQSRAGMVVCCESLREINDATIKQVLEKGTMDYFITSMPTLTGGSGAIALLITDGSFSRPARRRLLGGVTCSSPQFNHLCRWELRPKGNGNFEEILQTDAISVLKHGVELGKRSWERFLQTLEWNREQVHKTICHQVGSKNRETMLEVMGIPQEKYFITYPFLGNMGTVSAPITAAIAEEREFLRSGENVGLLGIASGLSCLMLGWEW